MYAITHCTLYTGSHELTDHALMVNGGAIAAILPEAQLDPALPRLDAQGWAVAPGFIDLQLNGCGGVMFNDAIAADTLEVMHHTNLKSGTTSYLPTLITTGDRDMIAAMELVKTYRQSHPHSVLGLHLEGPYLNPDRRGIHNPDYIRPADPAMVAAIAAAGPEVVRLLTLAPEMVAPERIGQLAEAGILVSAGHTNATYEEAIAGFAAGVAMVTHLFNAMSPWQGRKPGMVGAVFNHRAYAGIIADGHHVHFGSVNLAKKIKQDRLILVSDGTPPVGTALESFVIGGQEVFYRDGQCVSADGTLGGSALTLMEAVANCHRQVGIPLAEALRMAALYPARAIHVDDHLGLLSQGYVANVTIFDPETYQVQGVIDQGQLWAFSDRLQLSPAPQNA
ncbi:N-acetylglucosamine-6-phosphate deacetylase [filamentous cyanobacterium CCP5]|nr:N-acetylglucosamine-6-phosphate deacetylase [filamentous cyanobacterium CCP5]